MPNIFVVEDDDNIREMVVYALNMAGFTSAPFETGDDMLAKLGSLLPDLILLDIMLPGTDGTEILKRLKSSGRWGLIPVIMLTAKGSEMDRIKGLDLGADDYITKPFSVMEVISRVKAVLRRCGSPQKELGELSSGGIKLDCTKRTVYSGGEEVKLTYKEFELLWYMVMNKGIVLSREKLLEQVWGFDYNGESRTVDMHIKSLRQKLGSPGEEIKTIRNVGYKIGG